jgi:hypothetical protein
MKTTLLLAFLAATLALAVPRAVPAAVVTAEFLTNPANPGSSWSEFTTIGDPSASDYADSHSANGVVFTKVGGALHSVGAQTTAALNNGLFPDTYTANTLYIPADNNSLRVSINLNQAAGKLFLLDEVRTFDFPVEKRREYQTYALYGSAALSEPSTSGDPLANGWSLIANVSAFGPDYSTFTDTIYRKGGVSIADIDRACRFLLWDIPTLTAGSEYAEFDIYGSVISVPEPSALALLLLGVAAVAPLTRRRRHDGARDASRSR